MAQPIFDRVELSYELRLLLGERLVTCEQWGSIIDYPLEPYHHSRVARLDKTALHYDGGSDLYGWMNLHGGRNRDGETANMQRVDRFHKYNRGWAHGFAYGAGLGPFTGLIYEGRSFWSRWGAHLGDLEPDGIAENDEAFPIYSNTGAPNEPTEAWIDAYGTLKDALDRIGGFALPEYGHKDIQGDTSCPGPILYDWLLHRDQGGPQMMFCKYGDRNLAVEYWQHRILRINSSLLPVYGADGQYGDETRVAVALLCKTGGAEIGPQEAEQLDALAMRDHQHRQRLVPPRKLTGKAVRLEEVV